LRNKEILVTEDLTKRFSGYTALERLNLTVTEGTCVGFLGPNGAGKSTTIKILTGLIHPTNGKAFIAGYDIVNEKKQALSMIGAVVETPEFFPHFTPTEILSYFGKIRGLSTQSLTERTKKVLELVKMEDWRQKKIGKFSKGMKQRIALASALLHDPDLVILDEPTSGLDPRGMIEVRKIIKSLKEQGKTIFMSSHLLPETQEVCDKIALIDRGKLLCYDRIDLINKNTKNITIVIDVLESFSEIQLSTVSKLTCVVNVKQESPSSLIVEFDGALEEKAEFLKSIQDAGIKVVSFRTLDSNLESLYMNLVSDSVG